MDNFFDHDFNFNNSIMPKNHEKNDKLGNMICNDGIMLEPRLQEFLKKKKFYKENNMNPFIPIEKEFQITNSDKKILKSFLRGDRNIYSNKKQNEILDCINKDNKKEFPSKQFREDSRLNKLNKLKENENKIVNRGMFVPDNKGRFYEDPIVSPDNFNPIFNSRDIRNKPIQFSQEEEVSENSDDENYHKSFKDPRNKNIISDLESHYIKKNIQGFDSKNNNTGKFKNRYNQTNEKGAEAIKSQNIKIRNMDIESEIIRGIPAKTMKTDGYQNPEEHYFDFVKNNSQYNPTEDWQRGGLSTRLSNHSKINK